MKINKSYDSRGWLNHKYHPSEIFSFQIVNSYHNKERKEKELKDFQDLLHRANRWQQARVLREYIYEVEANAEENGSLSDELNNWIDWARKKADWYNPLVMREDDILGKYESDCEKPNY